MRFCDIGTFTDRLAFERVVADIENEFGYILDESEGCPSVIITKKGGRGSMIKTILEARAGYEDIFEALNAKKVNFEENKQKAIEEAIAKVEAQFAEEKDRIDRALEVVAVSVEIEVEDETEEEAQVDGEVNA